MINLNYSPELDKHCWERYNQFIAKNKNVWGISKQVRQIFTIKSLDIDVDVQDIIAKYEKFFGMKAPEIIGYIVTTPFSMINDDGPLTSGGVVFYSIFTANPSIVFAHELFHIFFEKYTKREVKDYEQTKEYFTVLMNEIFESEVSKGYPIHQDQRSVILSCWKKTKSLDACLDLYK